MILAKVYNLSEFVVKSLYVGAIMIVVGYVSMLAVIMFNAAKETALHQKIVATDGSLAEAEFEYINLKQSVTMDRAHELGFKEVNNPQFVSIDNIPAVTYHTR